MDSRQFGFIPNGFGGCTNALLAIRLSILQHVSINSSQYARILAIDFRKAFDSVNHCSLIHSLINNFDCSPFAVQFIRSFLSNRYQHVSLKDVDTPWKLVTSGVPQGSILGPILFTFLIDDLPQLSDTKIVAYADDITLIYMCNDNSVDCFQCVVNVFSQWADDKNLVINVDKTKCLRVSRSDCNLNHSPVVICGSMIEEVQSLRILGVYFSSDLKWNDQFEFLFKKCCRAMSLVKRLKRNCNCDSVVWQAYMGLVFVT